MVKFSEIDLRGEDWPGTLVDMAAVPLTESAEEATEFTDIYLWDAAPSTTKAGSLLEMVGNKTVKLIGRYRFRYDPPRTASTGAGVAPKGDFHLLLGNEEIAAWDAEGKARHGFKPGHRLPKKAFDAIVRQHPGVHGLKGRVLEHCLQALAAGDASFRIDLSEDAPEDD